jgi:hypothetical protein
VVVSGPSRMVQVAQWFIDSSRVEPARPGPGRWGAGGGLPVVRIKNKFAFAREELSGGYRDLMLSVVHEEANGLRVIGEIQVGAGCELIWCKSAAYLARMRLHT